MKDLIHRLEQLVENPILLAELSEEDRVALLKAAGQLSRPIRDEIRSRNREKTLLKRQKRIINDRALRATTGIRQARTTTVFIAPKQIEIPQTTASNSSPFQEYTTPRKCYACNAEFTKIHFFYDSMCPDCGDLNYQKRYQTASLVGKTAFITGSRLKIGYHATLLMLRAGARVIASTRFPVDAAARFSKEEDFAQWKDRLEIFGLDLRHTPSVEIFSQFLTEHLDRLDIIIHNAAQTVRRPPGFFQHLMDQEVTPFENLSIDLQQTLFSFEQCKQKLNAYNNKTQPLLSLSSIDSSSLTTLSESPTKGIGLLASAQLSQLPYQSENTQDIEKIFPKNKLDVDLQQVDLRSTNSWRYKIDEVPTPELLEVQLINAIAPFVLTSKLLPLMKKDFTGEKHIVNVTAMEGKFYRFKKSERHPHTNMAKAALNMLTHTSAQELSQHGIYMNAVDTGWVTDENPFEQVEKVQAIHDFQPPLDIVDGAARICDPFFLGISTGHHWCGKFLKDYKPIDW